MSRIGKQAIVIPSGVEVKVSGNTVTAKGPRGSVSRVFKNDIAVTVEGELVKLTPRDNSLDSRMRWGTYASHIANMIEGVTKGYEKKLVLEGIGYRAVLKDKKLTLYLGFSHPIDLEISPTLQVSVGKNIISVSGVDKEAVGQFAARVRGYRPPEPYKGKGVHYENEVIRRKEGKKVVA